MQKLQGIYSNKIALEFMHISDPNERHWIMHEFEKISTDQTSKEEKISILEELNKSETFNSFLSDKLKTSKRFGVEGLDSMISGLSIFYVTKTNSFRKQPRMESNTSAWEWLTEVDSMLLPTSSTNPCRRSLQNFRKMLTRKYLGGTQVTSSITWVQQLKEKLMVRTFV
jgi:hypothetical protein